MVRRTLSKKGCLRAPDVRKQLFFIAVTCSWMEYVGNAFVALRAGWIVTMWRKRVLANDSVLAD